MLRPIFVHAQPSTEHDLRYDTTMMVNGSVAVLNAVTKDLLGYPGIAIDETYPSVTTVGHECAYVRTYLREQIETSLRAGDEPVVFCTLLNYNAENALALLTELKQEFGTRLRTGVGGQLVRVCPEAYLRNSHIDHIGVGDAEVVLAPLLLGRKRFASGYKTVTPTDHYTPPLYDQYLGLEERLDDMARYAFGPFRDMRQLVVESVRGCAWAYTNAICRFCALEGIDTQPVFRDIGAQTQIERELVARFGVNWLFDVSNQWIPTVKSIKIGEWLRHYIRERAKYHAPALNRYVYLTTNSITARTAPLLHEAGVRIAYIGIDGWDKLTRAALFKTQVDCHKALRACAENGLYVRTSLVIGSGLTRANLEALPLFVGELLGEFGGNVILSFGNFLEIVLPGSADWREFEAQAERDHIEEARAIFAFFRAHGWISLTQEDRLNELRIRHTQCDVTFEDVIAARDQAVAITKRSLALSVTIRECEKLHRTNE